MKRRVLLTILVAIAAILTAASGANAAAAPGLQLTEVSGSAFPAKAYLLTLPADRDVRSRDLRVTEDGQAVESLRVVPAGAAGARTSAEILAIDTSASMRGAPIAAAMAAAREFAARRPVQQRLGVVFFNRRTTLALAPTTDTAQINRVLGSLPRLATGTRIYDATALAVRALAATRALTRAVLVLSDGADLGSSLAPAAVVDAARHANARVFSVGLRSHSYDGATLRNLADSTGGRYAEANARQLTPLFAALGRRFGREYLVTYRSLSALSTHVDVRAQVAGIAGTAPATYTAPSLRAFEQHATPPASAGSDASLGLGVALAAVLFGVAVFVIVRANRRTARARIADFTAGASSHGADDMALDALGNNEARPRRTPSRWWAAFAEDIDVAALPATPRSIATSTIAATVLVAGLGVAIGNPILALLVLAAPLVVRRLVAARAAATRREFDAQLPDNLQIVASAMRAGQSFVGALAVAVEDALEPVKRELHRAVTDERLGVPLDEALGRVARRMRSEELDYVGMVASLQRETGGSTAEVLERITQTIRERSELKRLVRGLTAQGRLGGGIVTAIPVGLTALFLITRPGYFAPLLQSTFGVACIFLATGMLIAGWIAIRKIVDIKV